MTKTLVIPPTIGRRVLVFAPQMAGVQCNNQSVPFDGGIAYVHNVNHADGVSMINVGYRDHNGAPCCQTSVRLYDRAQHSDDVHGKEWYAVWMDYQFQQALRAADPMGQRPKKGDVELVKLEENGMLTDAGLQRLAEAGAIGTEQEEAVLGDPPASLPRPDGLGPDASGEDLRAAYEERA